MSTASTRHLAFALAIGLISGCAGGTKPFRGGFASSGSLKASISQLQFENEKLRRDLADSKTEGNRLAERLSQEEGANTDLTAQLGQSQNALGADLPDGDLRRGDSGGRAVPAGGSGKSGRKPPFARIPGRGEPVPFLDARPDDAGEIPTARPQPRDLGPESRRLENDPRWLPVARDPRPVTTLR